MHWEFLIPVIAIIVFIVSSLLRGGDDEPARPVQRQGAGRGQPPNRPVSDIDRFLEEVNRRRRQAAAQGEVATGKQLPVPPRARPASTPPTVRRPSERPLPPPPPARVPPPPPPPPPPVAAPVPLAVPVPAVVLPALRPIPVQAVDTSRSRSPAAEQVVAMLRTPQQLQAAFLLREILGEPRCLRPHRPGAGASR
jgi:hypothetical protein